jgi:hypothetical protein
MPSCSVRILSSYRSYPKPVNLVLEVAAHQWVITMLSCPLRMSWRPPAPAIFASRDWANVRVTWGLVDGAGVLVYGCRMRDRNSGGEGDIEAEWIGGLQERLLV